MNVLREGGCVSTQHTGGCDPCRPLTMSVAFSPHVFSLIRMHGAWWDLHRYLDSFAVREFSGELGLFMWSETAGLESYSSTASINTHTQYPCTCINVRICIFAKHAHILACRKGCSSLNHSWWSSLECALSGGCLRHLIVSCLAGCACKAWTLLASKMKWAAQWLIDEAAYAWNSHPIDHHE